MSNPYVNAGKAITILPPAAGCTRGVPIEVGGLVGLPVADRAAGSTEPVELWTFGNNRIPKAGGAGVAFTAGQLVYFDATTGFAVTTDGPTRFLVGLCSDLANADAHLSVGLLVLPFAQAMLAAAAATHVVSIGEISVTGVIETVLSDSVTWVPILGTQVLDPNSVNFDMPLNGRLRYTAAAPAHVVVDGSVSVIGSNNQTIELSFLKNGVHLAASRIRQRLSTGTDVQSTALHGHTTMVQNDYLELAVRNLTSTANVTMETANVCAAAS